MQPKQETLCPYLVEAAGEGAPPPPPQPGRGSQSSADQAAQAGDPMSYLVEGAGEGAPLPPPQPGRGSLSSADQAAQAEDPMPNAQTWWRRKEKELHPLLPSQVETLYHQLIGQSRY